jgi:hypothetical protein
MMNGRKRFNPTLMTANSMLLAASLSHRILIHHTGEDLVDGIMGLLYGMAIGLFILGMRQMRREGGGTPGCARRERT